MPAIQLTIANKNLSSWSLRPWLLLSESGLAFEERLVPFGAPGWAEEVGSPNGRVPLLRHGELVICESLAICEYLAELAPEKGLWPRERGPRAEARAVSCEMHAGFADLRSECSMNATLRTRKRLSAGAGRDLARIDALLSGCRARHGAGGPFLFGAFGVADAMYAPVVTRVETYRLPLSPPARAWADAVLALPSMRRWLADAAAEVAAGIDDPNPHGAVLSRPEAEELAAAWCAAWSRRDLEAVLALFSEEARFTSPQAAQVTGADEVQGKAALRACWTALLAQAGPLRFELEDSCWDEARNALLVRYRAFREGAGQRACELWHLGKDGRIARGEALYGASLSG